MVSAEIWDRYGLKHPSGGDCRGLVDVVYHEFDPELLRALAPTIPFGLEHAILGNVTGSVGGVGEIDANTGQLVSLVAELGKL